MNFSTRSAFQLYFLLRSVNDNHVCGSPYREPHADHQSHGSRQEIRGSVAEGSARLADAKSRKSRNPPARQTPLLIIGALILSSPFAVAQAGMVEVRLTKGN
jgi:hypothetical protein